MWWLLEDLENSGFADPSRFDAGADEGQTACFATSATGNQKNGFGSGTPMQARAVCREGCVRLSPTEIARAKQHKLKEIEERIIQIDSLRADDVGLPDRSEYGTLCSLVYSKIISFILHAGALENLLMQTVNTGQLFPVCLDGSIQLLLLVPFCLAYKKNLIPDHLRNGNIVWHVIKGLDPDQHEFCNSFKYLPADVAVIELPAEEYGVVMTSADTATARPSPFFFCPFAAISHLPCLRLGIYKDVSTETDLLPILIYPTTAPEEQARGVLMELRHSCADCAMPPLDTSRYCFKDFGWVTFHKPEKAIRELCLWTLIVGASMHPTEVSGFESTQEPAFPLNPLTCIKTAVSISAGWIQRPHIRKTAHTACSKAAITEGQSVYRGILAALRFADGNEDDRKEAEDRFLGSKTYFELLQVSAREEWGTALATRIPNRRAEWAHAMKTVEAALAYVERKMSTYNGVSTLSEEIAYLWATSPGNPEYIDPEDVHAAIVMILELT